MFIPPEFLAKLEHEFQGRLRLRWSVSKHVFHVEQKVGRAALPPRRIDEGDDRMICARDGFHFVMAVAPQNFTYCPKCHAKLSLPACKTAEVRCACKFHVVTAFYPLTDALIEHLKKLDPLRDGHKNAANEADLSTARAELTRQRAIHNHIEAATLDDKYQLFSTPFVGYTGKTFTPAT